MINLDDAVIARLKKGGHNFEILVDPDLAYDYKSGEKPDLTDVLASEFVFKDSGKAEKASDEVMQETFQTLDHAQVAKIILEKGEVQLTSEKKKQMLENRRKQVVSIIARNALNPQTGTPHPPDRISRALEEAKFHVDLHKRAKEQVEPALKSIRPLIPIKIQTVQMAVKIPPEYAGKLYKTLHDFGEVKKEDWRDASQYVLIQIPGGMQDEFISAVSGQTHGEVEVKKVKNE